MTCGYNSSCRESWTVSRAGLFLVAKMGRGFLTTFSAQVVMSVAALTPTSQTLHKAFHRSTTQDPPSCSPLQGSSPHSFLGVLCSALPTPLMLWEMSLHLTCVLIEFILSKRTRIKGHTATPIPTIYSQSPPPHNFPTVREILGGEKGLAQRKMQVSTCELSSGLTSDCQSSDTRRQSLRTE